MPGTYHLHWDAEALWRSLEPLLPGLSVEVVASTDSTNTQLLERARRAAGGRGAALTPPGAPDAAQPASAPPRRAADPDAPRGRRTDDTGPCLLVAERQTQGRGRQGRHWQSSPGASLTFSLSLPLAPAEWSGLSLAVGLALADALDPPAVEHAPRVGLKWPNDLMLIDSPGRGRKLGGILIETVQVGARRLAVIGVGINVLPQPTTGLSAGYACLQELDYGLTAAQALARVAAPLVRSVLTFERNGFAPLRERYAARDVLAGQAVTTTLADWPAGVADGVDATGALWLRVGATRQRVASGEVSVRRSGSGGAPDEQAGAC